MVILSRPYGGLSNRLFQHIHFDAFCRENGVRFVNPFLHTVWRQLARPLPLLGRLGALQFTSEERDYSDYERLMVRRPLQLVEGWAYRNKSLTIKHRSFYRRRLYEANPPLDARTVLASDKANIAVHIRHGDYALWRGGQFDYPNFVYLSAIAQVLRLVPGRARIVIFTDDRWLDRSVYHAAFDDVVFSSSSPRSDHYLMSLSNYIVGPPSTFSLWASYIGQVKYCHINSPGDVIGADSFGICDG